MAKRNVADLRLHAEAEHASEQPPSPADLTPEQVAELVHELRTHQIELELQNEELRRTQQELIAVRDRYSELYAFAPVGYLTLSEQGLILEANLTASRMLRVERSRLVKTHLSAFVVRDDQDIFYRHRQQVLDTQQAQRCEVRLRNAEEEFWASLDTMVVRPDVSGHVDLRTTISNVSARKRAEEEATGVREELQERLQEQAAELERQRTLALHADRLRSLGEMAAGIAHELNQPLLGVRAYAEHLAIAIDRQWDLGRDEIRDKATKIVDQVDRMAKIIDHVRTFSREAGKPETQPVDVNGAIRAGVGLLHQQLRYGGIALELRLAPELPSVMANPYSLEEVFLNLLTNARDAVEERAGAAGTHPGRIIVETEVYRSGRSDWVRTVVTDTGTGILDGDMDRLFEPFYTTKGPDKGTGLGLSVSKAIVEQHDGTITVESKLGKGTTVTVALPVRRDREATAEDE